MSHFTIYKTCIENITAQQLDDAVELLAKLIPDAEIITQTTSYDGQTMKFQKGIKSPTLPNGIGFSVVNGKVYIHGDPWQQERAFVQVSEMVEKGDIFIASKINQNAKLNRRQTKTQLTEDNEIKVEVYVV